MIGRRAFLMAVLSAPASVAAQKRRSRIGWLVFGGPALGSIDRTLREALARRGLIDGRDNEVIFRHANGMPARLRELAEELVAQKPDLLMGFGGDIVKALMDASMGRVPIVGGVSEDPVRAQFAVSLARPGKNFTGVTFIADELAAKRIDLLKEAAPGIKRVATIWNPQHLDDEIAFARRAAETLGIGLTSHEIRESADIDSALRDATASGADSLFVIPSRATALAAAKIASYGRGHRLPVVTAWREFVDAGSLLSYGPNRASQVLRIASYVEKVLGGARPEELPVERPTQFELVINLETAKAIGLTVPPSLLDRADEVIE